VSELRSEAYVGELRKSGGKGRESICKRNHQKLYHLI
jgi:hypothetical protein